MEMGCIPGEVVTMGDPHGDPIRISIAGYQLSLRVEEAKSIIIEVII